MKTALQTLLTLVLLSLAFGSASAQLSVAQTWNFDPAHTQIGFNVTHMVISEVDGEFTSFQGTVVSENEDFTGADISFTIDPKTIDTENEKRDGHLRSADFFQTEEYPEITFESTSFEKVEGNEYLLKGNLTMRGVTKPVELDVTYGGTVKDPWGNTKAGFKLRGEVDRFDYGLRWDAATEAGNLVVSREVEIVCNVQLVLQSADTPQARNDDDQ